MDIPTSISRVVRGEFRWTELQAGLAEQRGLREWFFPPATFAPVAPEPKDVAHGFKLLGKNPKEIRDWAAFILAAAPLVTLEKLDGSADGEALLEALWNVAGGESLDRLELERLTAIAD